MHHHTTGIQIDKAYHKTEAGASFYASIAPPWVQDKKVTLGGA
jgi:hypothetical protein